MATVIDRRYTGVAPDAVAAAGQLVHVSFRPPNFSGLALVFSLQITHFSLLPTDLALLSVIVSLLNVVFSILFVVFWLLHVVFLTFHVVFRHLFAHFLIYPVVFWHLSPDFSLRAVDFLPRNADLALQTIDFGPLTTGLAQRTVRVARRLSFGSNGPLGRPRWRFPGLWPAVPVGQNPARHRRGSAGGATVPRTVATTLVGKPDHPRFFHFFVRLAVFVRINN